MCIILIVGRTGEGTAALSAAVRFAAKTVLRLSRSQAPHKKKRKKYRGKQSHSARESTRAMGIVASSVAFLLAAAKVSCAWMRETAPGLTRTGGF